MPNLMEFLRMANIFAPGQPIGNDLPSQGGITGNMPRIDFGVPDFRSMGNTQIASPDDYDAGARMRELYIPETQASDRYNEMIGAYPSRGDYQPSNMRRIGSALIALSQSFGPRGFQSNPNAIESGLEFLNRPYTEKLTDWKNQIGPAQQAAGLERQNNMNERQLAASTVSQELAQRRLENTQANQEAKNKIAADRAEVYRLKSLMPQHQFDFSGPNVMVANKQTGEVRDTGIPTGSLSDADKMALQQEQMLERIGAQGAQTRQTEELRQGGREALAETRGWKIGSIPDPNDPSKQIGVQYNEITGEIKPVQFGGAPAGPVTRAGTSSSAANRPESATQTRVRQFNAARELFNTRADLRPFIKLGSPGSNDFTITPPGKGFFGGATGPTPEQYKALQEAIYGPGGDIQPMSSHAPTNRQPIYKTQRNTRTGETRRVMSTDGGQTWQPVSNQ